MAKGKNKQTVRKGNKKSDKHAFLKKEWYRLLTPPGLEGNHAVGWVPANKTIGKSKLYSLIRRAKQRERFGPCLRGFSC